MLLPLCSACSVVCMSLTSHWECMLCRPGGDPRRVSAGPSGRDRCLISPDVAERGVKDLMRSAAEITMFDDVVVVYKFIGDLMFFVTGSQDENELILYQVLQGFYEAISLLLRYQYLISYLPAQNDCMLPGSPLSASLIGFILEWLSHTISHARQS